MAQPPVQTGGLLSRHGAENAQCYAHNVKSLCHVRNSISYNLEQKASLENRSYILDLKIN